MNILFVGLDVHKETIAVAAAEDGRNGEVRSYGTIESTPSHVSKTAQTAGGTWQEFAFWLRSWPVRVWPLSTDHRSWASLYCRRAERHSLQTRGTRKNGSARC